jgi:hypothetical protein
VKRLLLTALACLVLAGTAWTQPFKVHDLRVNGSVIAVLPAHLRHAHQQDLIVTSKTGTFPNERRWVSVFRQEEGGRFNLHPDLVWELDPEATVFDVGAFDGAGGRPSLVYLAGTEVRAYHLTAGGQPTPVTLLKVPTITVSPEPGDLPHWPLINDWKGTGQPWLGVPQFGRLSLFPLGTHGVLTPAESVRLHQPTMLFGGDGQHRLIRDYSLQLIYRMPQLFVQDFNGDGRADLIAAWQDNVDIYLQDAAGRFAAQPSKTLRFDIRTEHEKTLRSVLISPLLMDLNRDGYADLILTKMTGRITDRRIVSMVYMNRQGDLPQRPDARLEHDGFGTTILAQDLNGDGHLDLVFPLVRIGVMNIVRNLLSNRVEVSLLAHLYRDREVYRPAPDWARHFTYQIDMSDGLMLEGAWPQLGGDFDGDGRADLLVVGNGEVAVYLATPGALFARDAAARLPVKTSPHVLVRDLNGDQRADIVLWYDGEPEWRGVLKVLINTAQGWGQR